MDSVRVERADFHISIDKKRASKQYLDLKAYKDVELTWRPALAE